MEQLFRDVRYGVRGLMKSPVFTLVALVTIALGIGVNSTIFSLVNAVVFRPLPVHVPDELVDVYGYRAPGLDHGSSSYPDFVDYRRQTETLSGMMAYTNFFASLSIEGSSELVVGEIVSRDYFDVLGVEPTLGRGFTAGEFAAPGAGRVVVLSHPFWRSRFGGDPGALGETLRMNGVTYTVVGVAPQGFGGMFPGVTSQLWIPLSMVDEVEPLGNQRGRIGSEGRLESRNARFLWIRGRRRPGVELERVRSELEGISARLSTEYAETNDRERVVVLATSDVIVNPDFDDTLAPAGMVLLGAVGLVLLVACANLANMMLARASSRRRELAIRVAMGAHRGRLVRQMLVESLALALAGGAVAMALAWWLSGLVARFQPPLPIDLGLDIAPDGRVMVFTLAVAMATGIAFGLVPALRASRPDLVPALKDTGEGEAARGRGWELRDVLVVAQVAVSLVLLVGGALLVRSLGAAARVDLGYDVERTAHLAVPMEMNGYDAEESAVFFRTARARLEALPEVEAVGQASRVPLSLNNNGFGIYIDGHQSSPDDGPYILDGARVDEHYFDALDLRIVAGRAIEPTDREADHRVAVVTETFAERYWPGEEALGREFRTRWDGTPVRIVGIVEDYKVDTPGEAPKPYIHLPMPVETVYSNFIVATTVPAAGMVSRLEREVRTLDPELVFLDTGTLEGLAEVRIFPIRAAAWLIGAFGVLAVLLAAVGLYGVIGYSVSRRVREIGIRMAMGAERAGVVRMVIRQGMIMVAVGGAVGAVLAGAGARVLSSVLYVSAFDPVSFGAAFGVLAVVAALANWVPARRASRVDPMVALRGP